MLNGLALALLGCVNQVIGKENSEQGISLVTVNESKHSFTFCVFISKIEMLYQLQMVCLLYDLFYTLLD